MYTGPHIKRDGLVFGYDTGYGIADNSTATRFYKGANITNTSNTTAISTYWNNSGTAAWSSNDTEVPRLFSDLPVFSMEKLTNGSSHIGLGTTSATVSTVYTYSIYIWIKPGNSTGMSGSSPYFRPQPANVGIGALTYNGSSSWNTWPRGRWIRISKTATTPTNVTSAYISCYLNTAGDKVYFTAPQFTSKNFLSPFVNGTRSSTQSLIDLTKTTNVDVSNVSFDSTGQPTFDGTDDRITFSPSTGAGISQNFTVSAWVNCTNVAGSNNIVSKNGPYFMRIVSSRVRFNVLTSSWLFQNGTTILSNNTWYNFHMIYDGSTWKGYINGEQEFSTAKTGTITSNATLYVGYTLDGGEQAGFNGQIPIVRIYDRALSADEVQQNYNAYKNRFNL